MDETKKSKKELIEELNLLRKQVQQLVHAKTIDPNLEPLYKAVDMAPVAIWACDREYNIVYWNPGAERIYNFSREKVIGKNFLELFVAKDEYDQAWIDLKRVFNGETISPYLVEDVLPDGTKVTIQNVSFPIFDETGSVILLAEMGIDITENVLSRVHKVVVGGSAVSVWACDENWRIQLWNPGAERIYKAKKEEVIGKSFLELFVSEKDKKAAIESLGRTFKGENVESYVAEDILLDGTIRYMLTNAYPVYDQDGKVILQAEIGQDISREEIRRRTLTEISEKLSTSIAMSETEIIDLIYEHSSRVMDTDNMYVALFDGENRKTKIAFAIDRKLKINTEKETSWMPKPAEDILVQKVINNDQNKRAFTVDEINDAFSETTDNLSVPKSWMGVPLIAKGNFIGIIVLKSYETENAYEHYEENLLETIAGYAAIALENTRAYMHLQELNIKIAQTEEFITRSAIANDFLHRINNLAGTIPIWVDLIRHELFPVDNKGEKILLHLDEIDKEIRDLLNSASELKRPVVEEQIDVKRLLESIIEQVKIQYSHIICHQTISPNLPTVDANYFQISSAIDNLITNALESMTIGGKLSINAESMIDASGKAWIHIQIIDTGMGIPPEIANRIFEPFFSTKGPGRGYGLWRSKSYIEGMGGTLNLASEVGIGTKIDILLAAN